jgi:hypothetical protein
MAIERMPSILDPDAVPARLGAGSRRVVLLSAVRLRGDRVPEARG